MNRLGGEKVWRRTIGVEADAIYNNAQRAWSTNEAGDTSSFMTLRPKSDSGRSG